MDWCCMCRCISETVDHLLVHCAAWEIWVLYIHYLRVDWVMPEEVLEVLFGWNNWFGYHVSSLVWTMVPYA